MVVGHDSAIGTLKISGPVPAVLPDTSVRARMRVRCLRHAAAASGRIPRDGAIGHGEGAGVRHTAAAIVAVFPEMVLLVTVRVPSAVEHTAAAMAVFPEMVLLVMVRVP